MLACNLSDPQPFVSTDLYRSVPPASAPAQGGLALLPTNSSKKSYLSRVPQSSASCSHRHFPALPFLPPYRPHRSHPTLVRQRTHCAATMREKGTVSHLGALAQVLGLLLGVPCFSSSHFFFLLGRLHQSSLLPYSPATLRQSLHNYLVPHTLAQKFPNGAGLRPYSLPTLPRLCNEKK